MLCLIFMYTTLQQHQHIALLDSMTGDLIPPPHIVIYLFFLHQEYFYPPHPP